MILQSWQERDENLVSPLFPQKREASDARARVYHEYTTHPPELARRDLERNPLLRSHKRKTSRDQVSSLERQRIHERTRADRKREIELQ